MRETGGYAGDSRATQAAARRLFNKGTSRCKALRNRRKQLGLAEKYCRIANDRKGDSRLLRDVDQRVRPVGEIQYPKPSINLRADRFSARRAVQAPLAELWFAKRVLIHVALICLENINGCRTHMKGTGQRQGLDKFQIVSR